MPFSIDQALGVLPKSLGIHEKRAEILANNLANQDTPGFKARDIDFREALSAATANTKTSNEFSIKTTNPHHFSGSVDPTMQHLQYRTATQPSLDGNTVDGQIEQAEFAENAVRYLASLRFISEKIDGLTYAIRGNW